MSKNNGCNNCQIPQILNPSLPNLNHYSDKNNSLVTSVKKLSQTPESLNGKSRIELADTKISIQPSTSKSVYSEHSIIHRKNISKVSTLSRSRSEPSNLSCFGREPVKKGILTKRQPNFQANQAPRSPQYIQKAKDDKIAAYQSLPDIVKDFLKERLSYKILVTVKKELNGKETKKFMVVYEEFKQNINQKEKEKYQQNKLNGFTPENRFQFTKTVWNELDTLKLIRTEQDLAKIVTNRK